MKIENFIIEIINGVITWKSDHHINLYNKYLQQFDDGEYRLSIVDKKEKRSDQQNRYYWLYLGIMSEDSGYTKDELHKWAKGMFLTENISEVFGKKVRNTKTTTKLKKSDFQEYLINIENETGIPLPDTRAYLGYSYHTH